MSSGALSIVSSHSRNVTPPFPSPTLQLIRGNATLVGYGGSDLGYRGSLYLGILQDDSNTPGHWAIDGRNHLVHQYGRATYGASPAPMAASYRLTIAEYFDRARTARTGHTLELTINTVPGAHVREMALTPGGVNQDTITSNQLATTLQTVGIVQPGGTVWCEDCKPGYAWNPTGAVWRVKPPNPATAGSWTALHSVQIKGMTNASPAVFYVPAHGYNGGENVGVSQLYTGPSDELHGYTFMVEVVDSDHISLLTLDGTPLDSTTWPAWDPTSTAILTKRVVVRSTNPLGFRIGSLYLDVTNSGDVEFPLTFRDIYFIKDGNPNPSLDANINNGAAAGSTLVALLKYASGGAGVHVDSCRFELGPNILYPMNCDGFNSRGRTTVTNCWFESVSNGITLNEWCPDSVVTKNTFHAMWDDVCHGFLNNITFDDNFDFNRNYYAGSHNDFLQGQGVFETEDLINSVTKTAGGDGVTKRFTGTLNGKAIYRTEFTAVQAPSQTFPSSAAAPTAAFNSYGEIAIPNQPAAGKTVTVGSKVYTFVSQVTGTDGQVLIGPDVATTRQNLVNAINKSGGVLGTDYFVSAANTGAQAFVGKREIIVLMAYAVGAAGNIGFGTNVDGAVIGALNVPAIPATLTGGSGADAGGSHAGWVQFSSTASQLDYANSWINLRTGEYDITFKTAPAVGAKVQLWYWPQVGGSASWKFGKVRRNILVRGDTAPVDQVDSQFFFFANNTGNGVYTDAIIQNNIGCHVLAQSLSLAGFDNPDVRWNTAVFDIDANTIVNGQGAASFLIGGGIGGQCGYNLVNVYQNSVFRWGLPTQVNPDTTGMVLLSLLGSQIPTGSWTPAQVQSNLTANLKPIYTACFGPNYTGRGLDTREKVMAMFTPVRNGTARNADGTFGGALYWDGSWNGPGKVDA